jgi:hypothetical protein
MRMKNSLFAITLGAAVLAVPISLHWSPTKTLSLSLDTANARIGHPLSPGSIAGVHRRVYRRAARRGYYYGAGAYGAGVVGAAAAGAYHGYYGNYGYAGAVSTLPRAGYALVQFDNGHCEVWSNGYPSGSGWRALAAGLPNWDAGEAAYHYARSQGVCHR